MEQRGMGEKSDGRDSILGIKMGKSVKKCKKYGANNEFFERITHFLKSQSVIHSQKTSKSLRSLFFNERFAHVTLL